MRLLVRLAAMLLLCGACGAAGLPDAVAAMQRGDFIAAEKMLRAEAASHPGDAMTLSLLGAALDNLKRFADADPYHRSAVARSPRSVDVLNNFAAHLMLSGHEPEAAGVYGQVVALDPAQFNANVQLAQLALKRGDGEAALAALDRVSGDRSAQLLPLRAQAAIAAGLAASNARRFEQAEAFFERALQAEPAEFTALFDLGVTAGAAGHTARAREVLQAALRLQPRNVDVLYALASAEVASKQPEAAVQLLAQAARIDGKRADVQRLLAVMATELGALGDAAAAWDRYLALAPQDDEARRERDFNNARMGNFEAGIAGLEAYVARHPKDAVGYYELGQAERAVDVSKALESFNRALANDPKYAPALSARGAIFYQEGNAEKALPGLEEAARLRPEDAANLDRLGQAYQALGRAGDAVRVLREAARLAPSDSKVQLHLGRALEDSGADAEAKAAMERFRQLGSEKKNGVPAGLTDYLALSPEERKKNYRARLEKTVREHPDDVSAQLGYLKAMAEDRNEAQVEVTARRLLALRPPRPVMADAGRALMAARFYRLAQDFLVQADGVSAELALAKFYEGGGGKAAEGAVSRELERAVAAEPQRADLYLQAALFCVTNGAAAEGVRWLDRAAQALPQDRTILLRRALTLELAGRRVDSERQFQEIEKRWPEWYPVWLAHGMILESHGRAEEAEKAIRTAAELGGDVPADRSALLGQLLRGEVF
jgi:tetratricopeptide (TPR) repeat protein